MDKSALRNRLGRKTGCGVQRGWPCNTCFHAMQLNLKHDIHEYWKAVLAYRGDYKDMVKSGELKPRPDLLKELFEKLG